MSRPRPWDTPTVRLKMIEPVRRPQTRLTRVWPCQYDALRAASPAESADTVATWHSSHIELQQLKENQREQQ